MSGHGIVLGVSAIFGGADRRSADMITRVGAHIATAVLLLCVIGGGGAALVADPLSPEAAATGSSVDPLLPDETQMGVNDLESARALIAVLEESLEGTLASKADLEKELQVLKHEYNLLQTATEKQEELNRQIAAAFGKVRGEVVEARTKNEAFEDWTLTERQIASGQLPLAEVYFNPGSPELTPGGRHAALAAVERLTAMDAAKIRISGYTDTSEDAADHEELPIRRAASIAALLMSVGVSHDMIEIVRGSEDGLPQPTADHVSEPLNRCARIFAVVVDSD